MERVSILMQMVPSTSEIGWMINSMGLELKNGQMVRFMKDITLKEKNMGWASSDFRMTLPMRACFT
jgi:hypothetical protein